MFGKPKINDPYNTMGASAPRGNRKTPPPGAAVRDTDRRLSSWLVSERLDHPGTEACPTCKGTGSSGWKTAKGETIVCPSCRGFGY
jgi:hypothetical protein